MKRTRKTFLTGAAAAGAAAALAAAAPSADAASPSPKPSPKPTPTPSPAALETARTMRRFDATLSDEQIAEIARSIDEQNSGGAGIRKRVPLHYGNEPAPEFSIGK